MKSPLEIILEPLPDDKLSLYTTVSGLLPLHLIIGGVKLPERYDDNSMPQWCVKCPDEV